MRTLVCVRTRAPPGSHCREPGAGDTEVGTWRSASRYLAASPAWAGFPAFLTGEPGGGGTWAELRQAPWLMKDTKAGCRDLGNHQPGGLQLGKRLSPGIPPLLHGFYKPWLRVLGPRENGFSQDVRGNSSGGVIPAARSPRRPVPGLARSHPGSLGFGGKRLHLLALCLLCTWTPRPELGFNFPAPAASSGFPAGGAASERSEDQAPQAVAGSWASGWESQATNSRTRQIL